MGHYSYAIKTFLTCLVAFPDFISPTSFKYVAWVWSFKMECFLLVVCFIAVFCFIFVFWNDFDSPFSCFFRMISRYACNSWRHGMLHVASARPASADVIPTPSHFLFYFIFSLFWVFSLFLSFCFFWKVCIKGVCMCVWPRSLSCPLPSLDEGSMERMDLARRERSIVCTYFLYVVYLTCSRGEELKSKGEATVCFTPSCLWT